MSASSSLGFYTSTTAQLRFTSHKVMHWHLATSDREGSVNDDSSTQSESNSDLMRELECPICKKCVRDAHITRVYCYQCASALSSSQCET